MTSFAAFDAPSVLLTKSSINNTGPSLSRGQWPASLWDGMTMKACAGHGTIFKRHTMLAAGLHYFPRTGAALVGFVVRNHAPSVIAASSPIPARRCRQQMRRASLLRGRRRRCRQYHDALFSLPPRARRRAGRHDTGARGPSPDHDICRPGGDEVDTMNRGRNASENIVEGAHGLGISPAYRCEHEFLHSHESSRGRQCKEIIIYRRARVVTGSHLAGISRPMTAAAAKDRRMYRHMMAFTIAMRKSCATRRPLPLNIDADYFTLFPNAHFHAAAPRREQREVARFSKLPSVEQ